MNSCTARKSSEEGLEQEFNSLQAQREVCEASANAQRDPPLVWHLGLALGHPALDFRGTADGIHHPHSRLNDKRHGAIVIIMQRLHEDDLVGHVLGQEQWEIPASRRSPRRMRSTGSR